MSDTYRVRNWPDYNKALVQRGSICLILDKAVLSGWHSVSDTPKARGRKHLYSDLAIESVLMLGQLFKLPLRATSGFAASVFKLLGITDIQVPDYTILCRRRQSLNNYYFQKSAKVPVAYVLIDSTGLRLYTASQWKRSRFRYSQDKARWRKLHVAMDGQSLNILDIQITPSNTSDCLVFPTLLKCLPQKVTHVIADGAYDNTRCYRAAKQKDVIPIIPPTTRARLQSENRNLVKDATLAMRDHNVRLMRVHGKGTQARSMWKKSSGYHKRSRVENAMFRLKRLFSDCLSAKGLHAQTVEMSMRCNWINYWNSLAMPQSYKI